MKFIDRSLVQSGKNVAIIGGGPGGLMTAYLLDQYSKQSCNVTLFEASPRLGGKIVTNHFDTIPARYEAGAAELYDYSQLGPDPLRELIASLGLSTTPMVGPTVVLNGKKLTTDADMVREFGSATLQAVQDHSRKARKSCSPAEYYESDWKIDNNDPLTRLSYSAYLDTILDETARRYIEVCVHSDLATEPHHTSAMYGIQNWLMNDPRYMRLYTIDGGIEQLPKELASRISAHTFLNRTVTAVGLTPEGRYRVTSRQRKENTLDEMDFDFVVAALPQNWLPRIDWQGPKLAHAMRAHTQHYDHPAHYLRITIAFEKPFWRDWVNGSFFIHDAFGGCCVYDESLRDSSSPYGVLGWLLAGDAATTMANFDNSRLVELVLDSLPAELQAGRQLMLEAKVHRWLGSVNGRPMGYPIREPDSRHLPEPVDHSGLFLVGDYLFDSTLNGVLDSADTVVQCIMDDIKEAAENQIIQPTVAG